MADFVAAIDQGTTSTRCMLFDHDGKEVAKYQLEHEQILPKPGWVEHNPMEIWERSASVLQSAVNARRIDACDLCALGITNQRETTLVWNKRTGRPYYNAIVWQDTRTDRIANALERDGKGEVIRQKAGIPPATYFAAGKVQWILENVDGVRADAEAGQAIFGTTDTWLLWNLTGGPPGWRPHHRRDQRQPDDADEHRDAGLGRRTAVLLRHPALDAARDPAVLGSELLRHDPGHRSAERRGADRRRPR